MNKIAIIGGAGYIGSFLHKELLKAGFDITSYDIIKTYDHIIQFRGKDIPYNEIRTFSVIIYLAGLSGRFSCSSVSFEKVYQENVEDIMEVGKKMNSNQLLVYASSASILEGSCQTPVDETYNIQHKLLDQYALSMYMRETTVRHLNIPTIGLRFGTVIGISPQQRRDLVYIAMIKSACINKKIIVQNPNCQRAILCMSDLLSAIISIISYTKNEGHHVYNLSSFNTSIGEIAENISDELKIPIQISEDVGLFGFHLNSDTICKKYAIKMKGTRQSIIKKLIDNVEYILKI